jgi:hypothetical protein
MQAFRYVYEHHKDDADWFMKADDDTYVILENLRYFLRDYKSSDPVYFGHHFKTIVKQGYYSGGAGYVLSKEALTRFANKGRNSKICPSATIVHRGRSNHWSNMFDHACPIQVLYLFSTISVILIIPIWISSKQMGFWIKTMKSSSDPVYFGHHFKTIVKQGYYSGGAGYVLSKEALTRFANKGRNSKICRQDGGAEDVELGKCMKNLGVETVNSLDALGRSRFHCFDPETHLFIFEFLPVFARRVNASLLKT